MSEVFRNGHGKPVVALDIDGTLGDYHGHFLWFATKWFGREFPPADEVNPGMRLSDFMGVPHHEYQECKLAYRQGGLKRFMPAYPGVTELTCHLHMNGAEVWLCTTRPYLRLDNIDPDTREWLCRNVIYYDAVIFDNPINGPGNKYAELVRQVGLDRIVAVVDDLPEQVDKASNSGIRNIYLRDQPYNHGMTGLPPYVFRITNMRDLDESLTGDIRQWKYDWGQQ